MVGDPKHLSDLAKIDAAVLVRCRSCRDERRFDRDELARQLLAAGGSSVWSDLPRQLPCACGSTDVRVVALPYTRCARSYEQRLVDRALKVLDLAAYASSGEAVATPAVRLALHVLLPYVADRGGLLAFWERAQRAAPHPWETCGEPYYRIAASLRQAGWDAPV